eukprot:s1069_g22.t1
MLTQDLRTTLPRPCWWLKTPKRLLQHRRKLLQHFSGQQSGDDFAKALLVAQDAKEIAPAPAQVTATLLGTTVWWKLQSPCQACTSGTQSLGHTLAKLVGLSQRCGLRRCLAGQVSRQLLRFQLLQDDEKFLKMGAAECLEQVSCCLAHWISQLACCVDTVGALTT